MVLRRLLLLGLAAVLGLPAGLGDHCAAPTRSPTLFDTATVFGPEDPDRHYVYFEDPCSPGCGHVSIWIRPESNGWDGLQRQDGFRDDTCGGEFDPDMAIFF